MRPIFRAPMAVLAAALLSVVVTSSFVGCGARGGAGGDVSEEEMAYEMYALAPTGEEEAFQAPPVDREAYDTIVENDFLLVRDEPLSTFSVDVDTASYSNVRRFLDNRRLPPPGAVRLEEMINYFHYAYQPPETLETPFATHVEVAACPWQPKHQLAKIGLKGYEMPRSERPRCNLVFLVDVSGSMNYGNSLPLVQEGLLTLVENLASRDTVSIVTYAGSSRVALAPTSCSEKKPIVRAIQSLSAGGSTAGAAGINTAYELAETHFLTDGVNRVVLCTDGDFNVGITDQSRLVQLIEEKAAGGVFLSVFGFGTGNYNDSTLEKLADHGNGNYGYIDTLREVDKVFRDQLTGTLLTIAKDVKLQIDFNPKHVQAYRLIGYENRVLQNRDFNDDTKDAGDIGAGHTVTALYELIPPGVEPATPKVEASKYAEAVEPSDASDSDELFTVRIRFKRPDADESRRLDIPITTWAVAEPSLDFQFAAAVALFGQLLRDGAYTADGTYDTVLRLAQSGQGEDSWGYRAELINLVRQAERLERREE